jgi:transposase
MRHLVSSLVGLKACSGAHFLGRALRAQGHDVRLIPAQFVRPFVKSNKNDFLGRRGDSQGRGRQNMRFVPIKTDDQLDLQAIHRVPHCLPNGRNQLAACLPARAA